MCCTRGFVGSSSAFFSTCLFVELGLFLVYFMWPLYVAIDWGRSLLISLLVKLGDVAK